jgi:drug/metabolite transporter (DMT)-like permease
LVLSAVGTAFALVLFNKLVQDSSAVFASLVTYLIPVVAVMWGVYFGEEYSLIQLAFGGIILLGVYLVKLSRNRSMSSSA